MKAGLLAGLYALRALVGDARPACRSSGSTFIANPDEEIGSPSVDAAHPRASRPTADVCLVLECARANGDFVSARKGIARPPRIAIHGRAAHAGVEPEKGRSAILAAADLVKRLHALNGRWPGVTVNVGRDQGRDAPERRAPSAAISRSTSGP